MTNLPPTQSSKVKMVGPLDRGHDPVSIVRSVAGDEIPKGWDIFSTDALREERVKLILLRDDGRAGHYVISFQAINAGETRTFVRKAIVALRSER